MIVLIESYLKQRESYVIIRKNSGSPFNLFTKPMKILDNYLGPNSYLNNYRKITYYLLFIQTRQINRR
jgi:hypothetical protein